MIMTTFQKKGFFFSTMAIFCEIIIMGETLMCPVIGGTQRDIDISEGTRFVEKVKIKSILALH